MCVLCEHNANNLMNKAFFAPAGKHPNLKDILILYCGMTPGTTIKDLCTRWNPHSLGIDER